MKLAEFDYRLPKELIAQFPCPRRDGSRLMILNRKTASLMHKRFFELPEYLKDGDVLVLNNTKVIPARLYGKKKTGGLTEVLLLQRLERLRQNSEIWSCLIKPARGVKRDSEIFFEENVRGRVLERAGEGRWIVELNADAAMEEMINRIGRMPLPPYIKREKTSEFSGRNRTSELDRERYQTVFAEESGAVAAPTAGLHFTDRLLKRIKSRGVEVVHITLHTGIGTFKPVTAENIARHRMMPEYYKVSRSAFNAVKDAKKEQRRVIAVGSTVTRTLEAMAEHGWETPRLAGDTDLFIYPGYEFNVADALITNFHLPKSTLLMLAAAFAGKDLILSAYEEAVRRRYRFFSYGDAMMVL